MLAAAGAPLHSLPKRFQSHIVDAARPVPADVLEKCARLLGPSYRAENTGVEQRGTEPMRDVWNIQLRIFDGWITMSDGDLLLAILKKAADLNKATEKGFVQLIYFPHDNTWEARMDGNDMVPATPLEAALLAFAQLEPPCD